MMGLRGKSNASITLVDSFTDPAKASFAPLSEKDIDAFIATMDPMEEPMATIVGAKSNIFFFKVFLCGSVVKYLPLPARNVVERICDLAIVLFRQFGSVS
jgi:hypothetical protein